MNQNETIVYEGASVKSFPVLTDGETVWLTQEQMCKLFGRERSVITKHIRNVFKEGELDEKVVSAKFAHTTPHGAMPGMTQTKEIRYYNLDVAISVGYRVKSIEGTRFRIWATQQLRAILMSKLHMASRMEKLENRVSALEDGVSQLAEAFSDSEPFLLENRELIGFKPAEKGGAE